MNYDTFEEIFDEIEDKIDRLEKAQYTLASVESSFKSYEASTKKAYGCWHECRGSRGRDEGGGRKLARLLPASSRTFQSSGKDQAHDQAARDAARRASICQG